MSDRAAFCGAQGRVEEDYLSRLNAAMTTVRGVNRTNVLTLGRTFKSAAGIMQARFTSELFCACACREHATATR